MSSATELQVQEELEQLRQVADGEGWSVKGLTSTSFVVGFTAAGGTSMWVRCDADRYKEMPPRWRWCDAHGDNVGAAQYRPANGNAFFHGDTGVICAPWSRDAYKSENPLGPHEDWSIGNWLENSNTGQTRTLAAMAIRIGVELKTNFPGLFEQRQ